MKSTRSVLFYLTTVATTLSALFFAVPVVVQAAASGQKDAKRLLQSSTAPLMPIGSLASSAATASPQRTYGNITAPPLPTLTPNYTRSPTVHPSSAPTTTSNSTRNPTSYPAKTPYNSICSNCGYDSAETTKPVQDSVADMVAIIDNFMTDYGQRLSVIVCNESDQPMCGNEIKAQRGNLAKFQETTNSLKVQISRLACLKPNITLNTCPFANNTTSNVRVGRVLQDFDVTGIKGPIKVTTPRDKKDTIRQTRRLIIQKGVVDTARAVLNALLECGGFFTGDACSVSVSAAKLAASFVIIEAEIVFDTEDVALEVDKDSNGALEFAFIKGTSDNVLAAHIKLDQINTKADQANQKLDVINGKVDQVNAKLDQANSKLDTLLCPFKTTGLSFSVIGQGCDAIDQNCNKVFDECEEDQIPPSIELTQPIPEKPFRSIQAALKFLESFIKVSDDCAAVLLSDVKLNDVQDCTECNFVVTAADKRCIAQNPSGAATSSRNFVLIVDSSPPVITCGFFTPQDTEHIPGGFDVCAGIPPPFPPTNDFLHIDFEDFGEALIDVALWYQIETGKFDGLLPVAFTVTSNELEGRPVDNNMALVVERRDLPMAVARARVYLAPFSCHDGNRPSQICEQESTVSTRFYDIKISATDAAGNVGNKTCSVIVVPRGHFDGEPFQEPEASKKGPKESKKGNRLIRQLQGPKHEGRKSQKKDGKSAKQVVIKIHDPNDLRLEYPLSTQRYVISTSSFLWDPQLNATLTIPQLPPLTEDEGDNSSGGTEDKKSGKKGSRKSKGRCQKRGNSNEGRGKSQDGKGKKSDKIGSKV